MSNPSDALRVVVGKAIERAVLADHGRPCLYGVAGPCQHPNCLEAHFKTLYDAIAAQQKHAALAGKDGA